MKDRIQKKYNEATELYGQAKTILDEFDGKDMPQEKANEVDTLFARFDDATAEARRLEKAVEREAQMRDIAAPQNQLAAPASGQEQDAQEDRSAAMKAWGRFQKGGSRNLSTSELKSLRADSDAMGGFLVAPQEVAKDLVKFIDDEVFIRQLATIYPLDKAESLGIPTMDNDLTDPDWTTELATGTEDTVEPFGKRELKPNPLAKRIKVSKKLLRQSVIDINTLIRNRLGYKFAIAQEKGYLVGTGANQPLGMFTPSADGIPTSRDVIAASATAVVGDDFINAKHNLKAAYWNRPSTRWLVSRQGISNARKLKDGNGNYVWTPGLGPGGGLTGGLPQMLVDVPYVVSEYVPNVFTTGKYVALIGDIKQYWIAEALMFELQVLTELYAESNQVGYIGRVEVDAMPVLAEAFTRIRLA